MSEPRATMTVRQAALVLGVHVNTVRNWIREDLIEAFVMPHGFKRPYADSVMAMVSEGNIDGLRTIMLGKAARLERQAAALRRAIAELDD